MPIRGASTSTLTLIVDSIHDDDRGTRHYEFARGFIQNTVTILDDLGRPAYTLPDACPSQSSSKRVSLHDAYTHEERAAICFHTVLPDVISIFPRVGPTKPHTMRASRFLRKYVLEDRSPIFLMDIPASAHLGLSNDEKLFWQMSRDNCFMTLYSTVNWKQDTWIPLGTAYFSMSSSVKRLIALKVEGAISEGLLIYILITIPMIERKLHKEDKERARSQDPKQSVWGEPAPGFYQFYHMLLSQAYV